jgi:hypothetical protein
MDQILCHGFYAAVVARNLLGCSLIREHSPISLHTYATEYRSVCVDLHLSLVFFAHRKHRHDQQRPNVATGEKRHS